MTMQNEKRDNRKWYVLTTKSKVGKQESRRLTENYVEILLPLQRKLRTLHKFRRRYFEFGGLLKYISFGGQICILTEQEIERVERLFRYMEPVAIEQENCERNEDEKILERRFIGYKYI